MNVERDLIITILKVTRHGPVTHNLIKRTAHISSPLAGKLLRTLQKDGFVYLKKNTLEADSLQRLKLAVKAINLGADIESVGSFLQWQEFENIAAVVFKQNNYTVERNLRFKHAGRRWEIDIVGCQRPIVICVDCKHWHHGMYPSVLKRIVEEQVKRTSVLAEFLPSLVSKIECASWARVKLVPAVLSLVAGRFKFYDNVPIVPVLQLQDFLSQLPAYVGSLKHFTKQLAN